MFRKVITSIMAIAISICVFSVSINAADNSNNSNDNFQIVTEEQMEYELGEDSPYAGKYITYRIDKDGNFVRTSIQDQVPYRTRAVISTSVAVFIGGTLVGYLITSVVDGIVVAATGKSGADWVAYAIKQVVGKKSTSSITIDKTAVCIGYPPYGYKPDYCR